MRMEMEVELLDELGFWHSSIEVTAEFNPETLETLAFYSTGLKFPRGGNRQACEFLLTPDDPVMWVRALHQEAERTIGQRYYQERMIELAAEYQMSRRARACESEYERRTGYHDVAA